MKFKRYHLKLKKHLKFKKNKGKLGLCGRFIINIAGR